MTKLHDRLSALELELALLKRELPATKGDLDHLEDRFTYYLSKHHNTNMLTEWLEIQFEEIEARLHTLEEKGE